MLAALAKPQTNFIEPASQQKATFPLSERRSSQRITVSLEADWDDMSGNYRARVSDISLTGCFLETIGQTHVGASVRFNLRLPTGRWLPISGEVAFYQPTLGFGLRFTELKAQDRAMLRMLMDFYS
jgi:hypothetical protein